MRPVEFETLWQDLSLRHLRFDCIRVAVLSTLTSCAVVNAFVRYIFDAKDGSNVLGCARNVGWPNRLQKLHGVTRGRALFERSQPRES